jgi:hypothetical protein
MCLQGLLPRGWRRKQLGIKTGHVDFQEGEMPDVAAYQPV